MKTAMQTFFLCFFLFFFCFRVMKHRKQEGGLGTFMRLIKPGFLGKKTS